MRLTAADYTDSVDQNNICLCMFRGNDMWAVSFCITGISGGSDLGFYAGFGSVVVVISLVYFLGSLVNARIYIYNLTTCHSDALCLSIKAKFSRIFQMKFSVKGSFMASK